MKNNLKENEELIKALYLDKEGHWDDMPMPRSKR
jgi:hypothetical protein